MTYNSNQRNQAIVGIGLAIASVGICAGMVRGDYSARQEKMEQILSSYDAFPQFSASIESKLAKPRASAARACMLNTNESLDDAVKVKNQVLESSGYDSTNQVWCCDYMSDVDTPNVFRISKDYCWANEN